ncbi:putative ribonuclease H-like domain-containing protein [Tanacetum coccineum]
MTPYKEDTKGQLCDEEYENAQSFLANQPNGSQFVHKDLEQIHEDDVEEIDLKWQLALLSMRAKRYYQRTGKKITINESDTAGYDKSKVECFNCHKMGYFARECRGPRNQESRARINESYMVDVEVAKKLALMAFSIQRKFVPTAVLTKSGIVPVSGARPINIVAPKSFVNVAKTRPNAFQESHSLSTRPFYQQIALKNRNLNDKVNIAKVNSVNMAKGNRVTSVVGKHVIMFRALKPYTWIWAFLQKPTRIEEFHHIVDFLVGSHIRFVMSLMSIDGEQQASLSYLRLNDEDIGKENEVGKGTTTNADGTSTSTIPGPVTTEEKAQKNNDVKARSMLLMELPNEHQLTFNQYKDAKTLFAAIQTRFGGNDATKKTQKTLLKKNQLAILGENISQEDLHLKFLRSLPSEWNTHVVVWRNKPDLDSISFDDLYNNFKIVEQEVKKTITSSLNLGSQNMAFVSTPSSTNEVNTANVQVSTANSIVSTDSTLDSTANLNDVEEIDLKWQLALLSMRAKRYYQRTGKKITINESDTAGYDKSKVECFNCHKMGYFARECRGPRNQESRARNQDRSRRTMNVEETASKAMVAIDGAGFDWSYMVDEEVATNLALMAFSDSVVQNNKTCSNTCLKSFETLKTHLDNLRVEFNKSEFTLATYKRGIASVEEQLVFYKKNEVMLCDQIVVLKRDASFKDSEINALNIQIEKLKKEKESNQIKIDNFENASKRLDKLIGSQISDNNRKGYGFKDNKSVCKNSSNEIKKTTDGPIIEDWVFDCDEDDSKVMFVPTAVLTKSGIVPVSGARPINIVAPKSFVNVAKTRPNAFQESHSLSTRPFYQQIALKNRNLNDKVNTAKVNSVNTANGNRVTSAVGEQEINVVKSSACWCWLYTTQQMVINSACLIDKKELAIPGQTTTDMANMDFCDKYNMVAFLQKPTRSEEIPFRWLEFLAGSHIRYALTANLTIYVSLIEQFWQTVTVDTINDGEQ